jgi:ATP-binding cassette subfamily F protein uup
VQLLRLLMAGPNVLLLDEPTNDLDVETLSQVEDVLDGWAGTVVVVSHDRWFLERVCDTVWALPGDGSLRHLPGGVDAYLALRRRVSDETTTAVAPRGGDTRSARREITRIERRIARIDGEERRLHGQLAAHATDHERVLALDAELRTLTAERDALETEWLELTEATS